MVALSRQNRDQGRHCTQGLGEVSVLWNRTLEILVDRMDPVSKGSKGLVNSETGQLWFPNLGVDCRHGESSGAQDWSVWLWSPGTPVRGQWGPRWRTGARKAVQKAGEGGKGRN